MSGARLRLAVLVVLLVVAAVVGVRAVRRVGGVRQADAVCSAVDRRDWPAALAVELDLRRPGPPVLRAGECRALALMQTGRSEEAIALGEELLAGAAATDWLPSPGLTAVLAEQRRDRGELPQAAALAHQGAMRYPENMLLLYLEMDLRSRFEDEGSVLQDMIHRLPLTGAAAPLLRLRIAERLLARGGWEEAGRLLGNQPPADPEMLPLWAHLRARAAAGSGRIRDLRAALDVWERGGGNPADLRGFYALLVSLFSLNDAENRSLDLLANAVADADAIEDEDLRKAVYRRYIGSLAVNGYYQQAVELLERVGPRFGNFRGLTREDLQRARDGRLLPEEQFSEVKGTILLTLDEPRTGDRLWLSPPPGARVDLDYEALELPADGRLEVERAIGVAPLRWVARDAEERTVGSGTVWPVANRRVEARVARRPPLAAAPAFVAEPGPPDGRRRVFAVLLDSGDWRLLQYLRTRGDLPVFDALITGGLRGVLHSDPPFTAVAVNSIARPGARGVRSFFGMLFQLGTEVETMNFVGKNPFAGVRWLVPDTQDLFTTLGSGNLAVVNMLRSYGPLQAGRQGEMIGPFGRQRRIAGYRGARELTPAERAQFPTLTEGSRSDRELVEELAADFDTALSVAEAGEAGLLLLRVDSLDVFTHAHFAESVETGQDDADLPLYWFYRYIDFRLGELVDALDGDDLVVLFSDHGSRTALEHDTRSLFIAAGGGVSPGRLGGKPELRGVSRMLAELLGVATDWPETELSDWAARLGGRTSAAG